MNTPVMHNKQNQDQPQAGLFSNVKSVHNHTNFISSIARHWFQACPIQLQELVYLVTDPWIERAPNEVTPLME